MGNRLRDQVVGYFAVIPRQVSFFVAARTEESMPATKKLVFLVSRQTISTTRNAKIAQYPRPRRSDQSTAEHNIKACVLCKIEAILELTS